MLTRRPRARSAHLEILAVALTFLAFGLVLCPLYLW